MKTTLQLFLAFAFLLYNNPLASMNGLGTRRPVINTDSVSVEFSLAGYSVNEDAGPAKLTLTLSSISPDPISVTITTTGNTATTGSDFAQTSTSIQIPAGQQTQDVDIEIIDDSQIESDETFTVTISNPINAALGTLTSAQVVILDNDGFKESGIRLSLATARESLWADFDGDGILDLLVGGSYVTKVYRGDGQGGFVEIASNLPNWNLSAVAAGDYDNDGDLDLAISGWSQSGTNNTSIGLYNNNGSGVFSLASVTLAPSMACSMAWGDYDNDGDLDLLAVGNLSMIGQSVSKLYRNDGSGIFADTAAVLEPIGSGAAAWGDYDNDGYLDILLTGNRLIGSTVTDGITVLYHNNTNGTFTKTATLGGLQNGSIAWGDYDNDGDLDVLVNGYTASYSNAPTANRLYRNNQGTLVLVDAQLPGGIGDAAWGDYDNDGDLDLLLTGINVSSPSARVFRNDGGVFVDIVTGLIGDMGGPGSGWADYDRDGDLDILLTGSAGPRIFTNKTNQHNTIPTTPVGLSADQTGSLVTLHWSAASDQQTPTQALTYDLRIGTFAGGRNIMSPSSSLVTGQRLVVAPGSIGEGASAKLQGLDPGRTYYWSVQAIDEAYAGSPFSAEGSFTTQLPAVSLNASTFTVSEGGGFVTLGVSLSQVSSKKVTVDYATTEGTAQSNVDFTATSGQLAFSPGQRTASINIPIIDDQGPYEGDETFQIALSNPSNADLGAAYQASISIQDNEPKPVITFDQPSLTVSEATASPTVKLNLSTPAAVPVTVKYDLNGQTATAGSDFQAMSGVLTFAPGETSQTFNLTIFDDPINEPQETLNVSLSNGTNATLGTSSLPISLTDNDPQPQVMMASAAEIVQEGAGQVALTVSLSEVSGYTVTVAYFTTPISATAGADFTSASGTLTFNPGVKTKTVLINILKDEVAEADETFLFTLSAPTHATLGEPGSSLITISDYTSPTISFREAELEGSEDDGHLTITIKLSASVPKQVTVHYYTSSITATSGSDFAALNGTATFAPGEVEKTVDLTVYKDSIDEEPESLAVLLSNPVNGILGTPQVLVVTIRDGAAYLVYLPVSQSGH